VYGARRAADLHCVDRFERLGIRILLATEDGSAGLKGYVTAALCDGLEQTPVDQASQLYVCGPTPMMRAVATLAAQLRRPCAVSLEQVMGCGLGGCYSCVVLTRTPGEPPHFVRSCLDGPVFDATRIVWDALSH
ncbi:MAG: dihydroorotate dehydrogenase electron transfer subunit, partial [Vicinamibacterales bacterium]